MYIASVNTSRYVVALQQTVHTHSFAHTQETGSHVLAGEQLGWDGQRPERCSSAPPMGRGVVVTRAGSVSVCLGCPQDGASPRTALAAYNTVTYRFSRPGGKDPRGARPRRGSSRGATAPTMSSAVPKRQGPAPGCPGCRCQDPSQVIFGKPGSAHPLLTSFLNSTGGCRYPGRYPVPSRPWCLSGLACAGQVRSSKVVVNIVAWQGWEGRSAVTKPASLPAYLRVSARSSKLPHHHHQHGCMGFVPPR